MLGALSRSAARRGAVRCLEPAQGLASSARSRAVDGFTLAAPKNLSEVVKLELLEKESRETVTKIWEDHHDINAGRLGFVVDASDWERFVMTAKKNPMFCVPLPKGGESFVTFLVQMQLPHVFFTLLEEFNRYQNRAQPHMTLTYYMDLITSKGIVLVRGEVNSAVILPTDKAETTHSFYAKSALAKYPELFNRRPEDFDFKALLAECGIGAVGAAGNALNGGAGASS